MEILCPICNTPINKEFTANIPVCKYQKLLYSNHYKIIECPKCGLLRLNPLPTKEDISRLYSSDYYYGKEKNRRFKGIIEFFIYLTHLRLSKEISTLRNNKGKILDVGCGKGWFLAGCRALNWETYGTEITNTTSDFATKELHLDVLSKDISECNFPDSYFDVVTCLHSFEHLSQPVETLKEIRRIIKKKGVLILTLPNIDSFQFKISKRHWFHLGIPYHYYNYSTKNISILLTKAGFMPYRISHFSLGYNAFGFLQSLFNLLINDPNFLYYLFKGNYKIKTLTIEYLYNFIIIFLWFPLFTVISVISSFLESAGHHGGTIKITTITS
ncbi:MAG: class I SAM-dependent methyltransferase [bacterium]|nr:class I SAM-dependent methyltransferase [bacterium]